MAHTFTPGEYQTIDGRKAVVLGGVPKQYFPLIGYVTHSDGSTDVCEWTYEGCEECSGVASPRDLMPPKPLQCRAWMVRWLEDSQIKQDLFADYEDASQALDDCEADGMAAYIIELTGEVPTGHLLGGGR